MRIQAALVESPGGPFTLREVDLEPPRADEVLVRITHAVDTTGRADAINHAVGALRRMGSLALVGIGARVELGIMALMSNGISVHGVIEGDADPAEFIPRLVALHRAGRLPVERLVTEFPFTEIEAAARAAAAGEVVKPVLTFS